MAQLTPDWWMRGVTPRFGTFLETPRRGVEQRTGWKKGRSPALQKGRTRRVRVCFLFVFWFVFFLFLASFFFFCLFLFLARALESRERARR